jgi:hypothetical protein
MFVKIPAPQAQVTLDVVKITCEQLSTAALPLTSRDVVLWLSGYYHGNHDNTIIEPGAIERDRTSSTNIASNTAKRLSWMPSRTWDWANEAAHALALWSD